MRSALSARLFPPASDAPTDRYKVTKTPAGADGGASIKTHLAPLSRKDSLRLRVLRLNAHKSYCLLVNPNQLLNIKAILVFSFSLFLVACSKNPSGVYVSDEGSFYKAKIDLRSDGSAVVEAKSEMKSSASGVMGELAAAFTKKLGTMGTIPDGKWILRGDVITVTGKSPENDDVLLTLKFEPNGDLIAIEPSTAPVLKSRFTRQ